MCFVLLDGWELVEDYIKKCFDFKGFVKVVEMVNLVVWYFNKMGYYVDIVFGWGYCEVIYISYEVGGLMVNDFICVCRFDELFS